MRQTASKKNLTIRLAPELRHKLEFIAEREMRTLANQMTVFLTQGVKDYFNDESNSKDYKNYIASVSFNDDEQ